MDNIIDLKALAAEIGDNIPSEYLPVKTNYNECDWDVVAGYFVSFALNKELKKYTKNDFEQDCKAELLAKQMNEKHYAIIHKAFFEKNNFHRLGPTSLLLHTQNTDKSKVKINTASKKVATVLATMLDEQVLAIPEKESEHFLGEIITDVLKNKVQPSPASPRAKSYLPYLKGAFNHDLSFLASKPTYMLEQLSSFLAMYTFLHASQLALNLREWSAGKPSPKPLYFVIENEKVSAERTKVIEGGWNSFDMVSQQLFPILSTLELIQIKTDKKPLWSLFKAIKQSEEQTIFIDAVNDYCKRFISARKLKKDYCTATDIDDALENLFDLALAQFDKNFADTSATRYQANDKLVSALREYPAKGFVKAKGRIGRVLVLTQDNLLLLTNIAIGKRKQLRFHDLVNEFKTRGVHFDETSEERLIEFYERIGNVERMSDSGDDLYVRQTV